MVDFPKLYNSDFKILLNKKVVIYGVTQCPVEIYRVLKYMGVDVLACCVEKINRVDYLKMRIKGMPIINKKKLATLVKQNNNIIIQSYDFDATKIGYIKNEAKKLNVEFSDLASGEILNSYGGQVLFENLKNTVYYEFQYLRWKLACKRKYTSKFSSFLKKNHRKTVIICSPPKTADKSLVATFEGLKNSIDYAYLSHLSRLIDIPYCEKKLGKVRILMGVREPISQNISRLYQELSTGQDIFNWIMGDLDKKKAKERKKIIKEYEELFITNGDNVQMLWENFILRYVYPEDGVKKVSYEPKAVSTFLIEFKECVLDILDYPFNKEEGFAIIKEGNIEIFVYQLEKLNGLVPQLSEWVGVPFYKLENSNIASEKWVGDSYKQALKEIEITQEYFDKCFAEPYVQHCYSKADIEKFKARWRPHIKL